ncbi:hypothetical protein F66182_4245 [Fusarium sp. NRRL 66182]|nr:hypothetical protein F66182_4245 [Fusarium sp. NRRL 66182]
MAYWPLLTYLDYLQQKDPFWKLPTEILDQIFRQLYAHDIDSLIHASPRVYGQFEQSKRSFVRDIVMADFDHEMLQDALAIILFPIIDPSSPTSRSFLREFVPRHIDRWLAQEFPDPFLQKHGLREYQRDDHELLDSIYQFHRQMMVYIKNYMTKATSYSLPRAYLGLPNLTSGKSTFKTQKLEGEFDMYSLNVSERRRLFWAFLRYEWISKVYHYKIAMPSNYDPLPALHQQGGRPFQPHQIEALYCVGEYISSLYGALFAQCGDAWLPAVCPASASAQCSDTTLPPEFMWPNHTRFDPEDWALDFGILDGYSILGKLPLFGFDLVTHLLPVATEAKGSHSLQQWLEIFSAKADRGHFYDCGKYKYDFFVRSYMPRQESWPYRDPDTDYEGVPGLWCEILSQHAQSSLWIDEERACRQRAWVFLDDARLYPQDPVEWFLPRHLAPQPWRVNPNIHSKAARRGLSSRNSRTATDMEFAPGHDSASRSHVGHALRTRRHRFLLVMRHTERREWLQPCNSINHPATFAAARSVLFLAMKPDQDKCGNEDLIKPDANKSLEVQLVLSLVIGVSAFFLFCFLRPRWPALYAARKRRLHHQLGLPSLPNTAFGWIPKLYKITEEQVLASAGLDAFVFLSFFKMAIRLFAILAFFATVVLWPINTHFGGFKPKFGNGGGDDDSDNPNALYDTSQNVLPNSSFSDLIKGKDGTDKSYEKTWLWSYVIFTYFFAGLTIYYLNLETFRIIRFRQDYLGSQSTITDRTFRLTGIPEDLRSEDAIKNLIEKLEIGKVDRVTVCRDWKKLDDLVDLRDATLRALEAAWATFLKHQREKKKDDGQQRRRGNGAVQGVDQDQQDGEQSEENGRLLGPEQEPWDSGDEGRPKVNIRYGTLGFRSRNVDAIDYYEERLRRLDAKVIDARKKTFTPTDTAIVTMDSVASCQMAIQARIDPRPGRLLTKVTPSPSDLVWRNTYSPRGIRRLKSWAITLFITVLTLVFIFPTVFLASLVSICTINKQLNPAVGDWLQQHAVIYSLVSNGLPVLVISLLNVAVPYLYDFLSNHQGMISQGDVELSVISKNYFFTFFNTFFIFAVSRTGVEFWTKLQELMKDTSRIPGAIAKDVEELSIFYISFVMLQGIGLMPFRILEAGSVFLYPILRWMSKTPRDALELKQPPVFQYGFFLPTSLLVFNLCLIYSILNYGFAILIVGTIYFSLGYFAFKYMVLYAMDQPQHATGGAWRIICYRIIVGLLVFEVVMVGRIATEQAFIQSVCILPLVPFSIWYSYYIKQRFEPLTRYIALRAIRADEDSDDAAAMDDAFEEEEGPRPSQSLLRRGSTLDEYKEKGLQFVNPSLVAPLQQPWIYDEPPPPIPTDDTQTTEESQRPVLQGVDSTLGIGDENVWRDNGGSNV